MVSKWINVRISKDVHEQLKLISFKRRTTMNKLLEEVMSDWFKKNGV